MTENEYINATDLARLRAVAAILNDCHCPETPNETRLKSVKTNVSLMIENLFEVVKTDTSGR